MKLKTLLIICLLSLLGFSSCDNKPKPEDIILPEVVKGSVMIANEGNFQSGNATLTVLDITQNKLYQDVFETTNGRKLGDVFQSINVFNNKAYLIVNNSQKIEVVSTSTYKTIHTITGFTSPRYMVKVDANRAYVSEYYANAIRIVDLTTHTIIGSIPANGLFDEMVLVNNKVYVTNATGNYVFVIDVNTNSIVDSIQTVYSSNSIQVDSTKNIWVLSNGDPQKSIKPALQRINTKVDTVDKNFTLSFSQTSVSRLRINNNQNTLYWLSKHIYKHQTAEEQVSSTPFIQALSETFYGLGVNPFNNEIYVSDAKDFVQTATIHRYHKDGFELGAFKAGIIPGDFYFYYP